jgi:hypothetical protein
VWQFGLWDIKIAFWRDELPPDWEPLDQPDGIYLLILAWSHARRAKRWHDGYEDLHAIEEQPLGKKNMVASDRANGVFSNCYPVLTECERDAGPYLLSQRA